MVWLGQSSKCLPVLVTLLLGPKCGHLHVSELHLWLSHFNSSSELNLLQLCWDLCTQSWSPSTQQQFPFLRKKNMNQPESLHFKTLLHIACCSSLNCSLLTFSSGTKRQSVPVTSFMLGKIKLDSGFP